MSSSDYSSDDGAKVQSKKVKTTQQDFQIKPSKGEAIVDTSKWPLLLKNYD